jgi:nucleotide-binding universal stress UspA family protein
LVQIADEQGAQMIVVGNKGMTGARRVLGSVPNHVSHHARCDVLIVSTS